MTYDPDAQALYIQLSDSDVLATVKLAEGVYLDIDANGQAVGFEILNANQDMLSSIPALPNTFPAEVRSFLLFVLRPPR